MLVGVSQKIKSLKTHSNPDNPRSLQRPPTPSSIAYDSLVVAGYYHKRGMYSNAALVHPRPYGLSGCRTLPQKGYTQCSSCPAKPLAQSLRCSSRFLSSSPCQSQRRKNRDQAQLPIFHPVFAALYGVFTSPTPAWIGSIPTCTAALATLMPCLPT